MPRPQGDRGLDDTHNPVDERFTRGRERGFFVGKGGTLFVPAAIDRAIGIRP